MLFHFHQESAQFNIVLLLLRIIFEHNLKKLLNALEFSIVQCQGYKNYCKVVKGYQNLLSYFELYGRVLFKRSCWGKTFCQMLPWLKNFFNSSKIPFALVPGIKNDSSLNQFSPIISSVLFTKSMEWGNIYIYIYIYMAAAAYHVISKEVENCIFRHNRIYRHTFMYKQPYWQSNDVIVKFLWRYYIVISDTQVGRDIVKHELRVASYELRVSSYKLRVKSLKARV